MNRVTITGHGDDGNCVQEISRLEDGDEVIIRTMAIAIAGCGASHNFPPSDYSDDSVENLYSDIPSEILETFSGFVPYGEYGTHHIVSIELSEVIEDEELL